MIELKPCPFCGEKASVEKMSAALTGSAFVQNYRLGCKKCQITFWGNIEFALDYNGELIIYKNGLKDAAEKWNRRA